MYFIFVDDFLEVLHLSTCPIIVYLASSTFTGIRLKINKYNTECKRRAMQQPVVIINTYGGMGDLLSIKSYHQYP